MIRSIVFASLAAASFAVSAQDKMEPGEWELTTTVTMAGMPKPQTATVKHCIKKEDIDDPSRWMGGKPPGSDCTLTPGQREAGSATWEVSCPSAGMKGQGRARFAKGMMDSEMRMSGMQQGQKFEVHTRTRGRRVGPCGS